MKKVKNKSTKVPIRTTLAVIALAAAILFAVPSYGIDWTHDCGATYPTLSVDWFAPGGPAEEDGRQGCQNFGTSVYSSGGLTGHCNTEVRTKTRVLWDTHMSCVPDGTAIACEIHGSLACLGTNHPYALTCSSPTQATAFGNQQGAFCVGEGGAGVLCQCDEGLNTMHCGVTSP